jgi:hypothetical protein
MVTSKQSPKNSNMARQLKLHSIKVIRRGGGIVAVNLCALITLQNGRSTLHPFIDTSGCFGLFRREIQVRGATSIMQRTKERYSRLGKMMAPALSSNKSRSKFDKVRETMDEQSPFDRMDFHWFVQHASVMSTLR